MHHRLTSRALAPALLAPLAALTLAACGDSPTGGATGFLAGTAQDPQVAVVLSGRSKALTLFKLGEPTAQQQVPLGAEDLITATGAAIQRRRAAVPLGNAGSVAIVDLQNARIERYFAFPQNAQGAAGNATGVAWVSDNVLVAANLGHHYVGIARLNAQGTAITDTVHVAQAPTAVVAAGGSAFVVSGNTTAWPMTVNGVVTRVDPGARRATGVVTVGLNPTAAALGPDGKLYVVNTGDYGNVEGSLSIVNPQTLVVEATVPGFGSGPGAIAFDANGLAYVSSYAYGTVVWDPATRQFVRGLADPICAPQQGGGCRGGPSVAVAADGTVYQAFYGSRTVPSKVFVYRPRAASYALVDSVTAGDGPLWLDVRSYR